MKHKTEIILGPPGTGKTTRMLSIVESMLERGIRPEQIGFFTFSRKAAEEARTRAMAKFSLSAEQLPFFRTLHSLAYHRLGLNKESVVQHKHHVAVGHSVGVSVSYRKTDDNEVMTFGSEDGDKCLQIENLSRVRMIPLRQAWDEFSDDMIAWGVVDRFVSAYRAYKHEEGLLDFNDMIQQSLGSGLPRLTYLMVDEAQDLSTLQWKMVEAMGEHADKVYVSGDDDQAIYRWGGADVDYFINLQGRQTVLDQSYRVPHGVYGVAQEVVGRIAHRRDKAWKSRDEAGVVERYQYFDDVDISQGTWYLLARNRYLLNSIEKFCIEQGFSFVGMGSSPIRSDSLRAVQAWETLRRGDTVTVEQACLVYDFMKANRNTNVGGFRYGMKSELQRQQPDALVTMQNLREKFGLLSTEIWHVSLDRLNPEEVQYFIAALKRKEKLTGSTPRIRVSTIHGVKGGEADHVMILTDVAGRNAEPTDDEHRCMYVGVTRAKKSLHIVEPSQLNHYDL